MKKERTRTGHMFVQVAVSEEADPSQMMAAEISLRASLESYIGEAVNDGRTYLVKMGKPSVFPGRLHQDAVVLLVNAGDALTGEHVSVLPDGLVHGNLRRSNWLKFVTFRVGPEKSPIEAAKLMGRNAE